MNTSIRYSIDVIRESARELVEKGVVTSQQSISTLCQYIPMLHWQEVETELKLNDLSFSDRIIDLLI